MPDRRSLGDFGERVAAAHLEANGYTIRDRNFRTREGEIDIVAEKDGCLVFIEVRARRGQGMGSPAESITPRKQERLLTVASAYLQAHPGPPARPASASRSSPSPWRRTAACLAWSTLRALSANRLKRKPRVNPPPLLALIRYVSGIMPVHAHLRVPLRSLSTSL